MKTPVKKTMINMALAFKMGVFLFASPSFADKQEIMMDDSRALHVEVSQEGLSCLGVKGDRIKEVLGLSEEVTVEKDETNGFLFLRGVKNKEQITLLTEGGEMQDVVLKPTLSKGSTRILFTLNQVSKESNVLKDQDLASSISAAPFQKSSLMAFSNPKDQIISLMKRIQLGAGSAFKDGERAQKDNFSFTPLRALSDQQLKAHVYEVKSLNENTTHVLEKDFYIAGDVAISLSKRKVRAGDTFYLYVVRTAA